MNIIQRLGGSLGTAVATVILQQSLTSHAKTPAGAALAFQHTWWWLTAISLAALLPAIWLLLTERRTAAKPLDTPGMPETPPASVVLYEATTDAL